MIFDAIHDNVATKTEMQAATAALRHDVPGNEARLDAKITGVSSRLDLVEHRLLSRLGGLTGKLCRQAHCQNRNCGVAGTAW